MIGAAMRRKKHVIKRLPKSLVAYRANEIYRDRLDHEINGSAQHDWERAESDLSSITYRTLTRARMYVSDFWSWTGLRDKKGWDFISILIVPLTLAYATYTFQEAAKTRDRQTLQDTKQKEEDATKDKWRAEVLSRYFIEMQQLLNDGLSKDRYLSPRFIIAQTKTVLALQQLDPYRQRLLIQFLEAADLNKVDNGKGILYKARMSGSNLMQSNFSGIQLIEADLSGSILSKARFNKAILTGATLDESNLTEANLSSANLAGASLRKAALFRANMSCTMIRDSDLTEAYLNGANLSFSKEEYTGCANGVQPLQQLQSVKSLRNATFNTRDVSIYRFKAPVIGNVSIESNWLVTALLRLPFLNLDTPLDVERSTSFPDGFNYKTKGMKPYNGVVKVQQSGITW